MNKRNPNVNPKIIADTMAEKIKNAIQNGQNFGEILNMLWDILQANGIEIPDKVKQAISSNQKSG